jgi:hypothetical protein
MSKTYTFTALGYGSGPEGGYVERTHEIEGPLYHGGARRLREGAQLTAGRRTNGWGDEGARSTYVHFSTRLETAAAYAERTGGHVYEVEPTGEFAMGYAGDEFKSVHPLNVVRRLDPKEWQA